jgi:hypothetical protein
MPLFYCGLLLIYSRKFRIEVSQHHYHPRTFANDANARREAMMLWIALLSLVLSCILWLPSIDNYIIAWVSQSDQGYG